MAKKSTGRPVGRPKGTRTATVELETVSFKAPKEFVEQVKRYAKQRSRPVSELVRDGLEWLGRKYPELKATEHQVRLEAELRRQEEEGSEHGG